MRQSRREFVKGAAWMVAVAAAAAECRGNMSVGAAQPMSNFAVAPLKKIRVGIVGSERGTAAADASR